MVADPSVAVVAVSTTWIVFVTSAAATVYVGQLPTAAQVAPRQLSQASVTVIVGSAVAAQLACCTVVRV